ncbi:uncharacterized protein TNCV_5113881 [Trichonephila clavipes]|nr:uncharacterized protein TNCV_5113881 [Trichonephila clavipes]
MYTSSSSVNPTPLAHADTQTDNHPRKGLSQHSSSTPENYKSRRKRGEERERERVVNAHYTRPHYVPVIRQQFQTIEMILRLYSGDIVPFVRGRVIAVLHFRLRQIF